MPCVVTTLEYLKDLELYQLEKPYFCLMPASDATQVDNEQIDNLEFESHHDIRIEDIRPLKEKYELDEYGFEVLSHTSRFLDLHSENGLSSTMALAEYQIETEDMLNSHLGAVFVKCYDIVMRRNIIIDETVFDLKDQMHVIGPARGAHNDITYHSGPNIINRYLSDDEKQRYFKPGYRFRIVNTWRSTLPVLEDRPLALCDSRTVAPSDLIACDRIIPDRVGEVYYLKYNSQHKWYWLSRQTCFEPLVFVLYDTKAGNHARFCPHVSFPNPEAPINAPPRRSVETRSIVVTQE
ncbi:hypothetical protein ONS95_007435 [Cadophora gregata]|uniref:uncharacterized protein n=1 Tax=Cadophora gregata TaxID=51156 RepID=UPI0026DA888B|nr:uncharacterized protein ONS95_007435 [Cadophora gregata]KAK0118547.1 hypothetical protein ONS96_011641 [Cadophora gregata f. sp. sojae]KAK0125803.1 hypothetical protein ONS95_007435 [Cadophora gregata]